MTEPDLPLPPQTNQNDLPPVPAPPTDNTAGPGRNLKLILSLTILILAIAAVVAYALVKSSSSGSLFDQALSNALQTDNFTQYNTDGTSHLTIAYDVSNPGNPRIQTDGKFTQGDTTTAFNGYGTFSNSYIKFMTFTTAGKSVPPAALNQWFQVRKDGYDASGGYFATLFQNDPHSAFFGDLIFGNFSKADRAKLLEYIRQHKVYQVTESTAKNETYKGQAVAVYDVTENQDALAAFNELVGAMIGLPDRQVKQDLANMHYVGTAKIYVSRSTKQFIHADLPSSSTLDYYAFGSTRLGDAPTPQTTFEAFENLIALPAAGTTAP